MGKRFVVIVQFVFSQETVLGFSDLTISTSCPTTNSMGSIIMFCSILIWIFSSSQFLVQIYGQQCTELRVRRNIRYYSAEEWTKYQNVILEMYNQRVFDDMARIHHENFREIHDYPQFLFWHRYFVYDFENRMREVDPQITLPYWDAASDFARPHSSFIFSPSYFGGNGDRRRGYCIRTSFLSQVSVYYPNRHCLRRDFQGDRRDTISPWHSPAFITSLIQTSRSYDSFRQELEHSLHNAIHFAIGGASGDFSKTFSPLDALFYLHHANVDRIWTKWQNSRPRNREAVDGFQLYSDGRVHRITRNFRLHYYGVPISSVMRNEQPPLCYTYDDQIESRRGFTEAVRRRLKTLPRELLLKYFPQVLEERSFEHDFADLRALNSSIFEQVPIPRPLPERFFQVMGFNVSRGMEIQRKISQFVKDINSKGPTWFANTGKTIGSVFNVEQDDEESEGIYEEVEEEI